MQACGGLSIYVTVVYMDLPLSKKTFKLANKTVSASQLRAFARPTNRNVITPHDPVIGILHPYYALYVRLSDHLPRASPD